MRQNSPPHRVLLPASTSALLSLSLGFAVLIGAGTLLLLLPVSSNPSGNTGFITALFTATSAVCVTGLVVVNTGDYWTGFGQVVIAGLMVAGGLGIMTAGLVILAAIGRRVTLNQRLIVRESLGGGGLGHAVKLGRYVVIFAITFQAIGFALLFARLIFKYDAREAAWQSLFHSISAFNNAGFTIFPDSDSLTGFQSDPVTLAIIGALIVLGALSFPVIAELSRHRRINRWSIDTRLVLIGTMALWVVGAIALVSFELTNPATLQGMSLGDKIANGAFQAITARTAGFSTIDYSATRSGTDFLFGFLMFVGGASGSVAGGIKINTAMVLVFAGISSFKGHGRTEIFGREVPATQVLRALAVVMLAAIGLFLLVTGLAFTESSKLESGAFSFMDVLFETMSAFGTVGLSRGITPDLSDPGKIVLTIAMYVGRLGPLTIAMGMALGERRATYRYAEERVRIG
jgi:trk system potassium uptake protein TrkH